MAKKRPEQPLLFEIDREEASLAKAVPFDSMSETSLPHAVDSTKTFNNHLSERGLERDDLVVIVDAHSLIYQVFHAMPSMTGPDGRSIGAVHGFLRDIADLREVLQPSFLVCAFDPGGATFRSQIYPPYKQNREPMPEELRSQIPLIQRSIQLLGIPLLSQEGFEADDVIATLVDDLNRVGCRGVLVTSDKDCRQLLSERIQLFNLRKREYFGVQELSETWGIRPDQVVDFQALVGDSVDNVPGVPLIGPKYAKELLQKFQDLETVLGQSESAASGKRRENLLKFRDQAILSKDLVALRRDVPIPRIWHAWRTPHMDLQGAKLLFEELGLKQLSQRFFKSEPPPPISKTGSSFRTVTSVGELRQLAEVLTKAPYIAFDTETTSSNARDAEPVGYSIASEGTGAFYIPLRAPRGETVLPCAEVNEIIKPILENRNIQKSGQNLKFDLIVMRSQGIQIDPISFDTMVADYLLDPGQRNHGLGDIAKRWLHRESIAIQDLIGSGKNQKRMDQVPLELISEYACEDVELPLELVPLLKPKLEQEGLWDLFENLELPLIEVLAEMEFNGIQVDRDYLSKLSEEFESKIGLLHDEIMSLAGTRFNPDSPKQLATILFDVLKLPTQRKTKTGQSTDVDVLQELASLHPLPAKLIEYRQASKLKGTYIDALPQLIITKTERVHTSFRQDVAATGRLSSSEPNLQNIPVRTEDGRKIRTAFRPGIPGWVLFAADYSQIELRVLAHFCRDASLQNAFHENQDIHTMVASEVYGVPLNEVTSSMRRNAKAINFGIIYGQSPFGLAKSLSISKEEAGNFIDSYFARYPGVLGFISETLKNCRNEGFVTTIAGRKRWIRGVRDFEKLDGNRRKMLLEPERMAVNTVIQGSAADMIKLAMIGIHRRLKTAILDARMLLQIHDELIFEVAPNDLDSLRTLVVDEMSSVVPLSVPIQVDTKFGPNWDACE